MTHEPDFRRALAGATSEPLLPVEKKLIAVSLGTGLVLLVLLVLIGRYAPIGP
jgi:hypothetical protein